MNAVVVYESMYGNTHEVADAIGRGLSGGGDAVVLAVDKATPEVIGRADLLVVGGPTHAHGMSRETTRRSAIADASNPDKHLAIDPDAAGEGLRDWFDGLSELTLAAAAFDTRVDMVPALTGRASKGIGKRLRHHGCHLLLDPMSFLVDKENALVAGELERAERWGRELRRAFAAQQPAASPSTS